MVRTNFMIGLIAIILIFSGDLANAQVNFTSSNLPVIIINLDGDGDPWWNYENANMKIIYNGPGKINKITDPAYDFNGRIAIKTRGNSSSGFNKKSYRLETKDTLGEDLNVSLLGLSKENDWILYASYNDKTFLRNPLAMWMSRKGGQWASNTIFCEMVLNGEYVGIYILMEKIKRDDNRVDINKMSLADTTGEALTGGYLVEYTNVGGDGEQELDRDKYLLYPKYDRYDASKNEAAPQQVSYIKNYLLNVENLLENKNPGYDNIINGFPGLIDIPSFVDQFIIQEACKNSDAYDYSSYFHKNRSGKLKSGPSWDFDQSLSNSTYNCGTCYDEWVVSSWAYIWFDLFEETNFQCLVKQRWAELRQGPFHADSVFKFIDDNAAYLDEAQVRNFQRWNVLGRSVYREPSNQNSITTYAGHIQYLKDFIQARFSWMDDQISQFPDCSPDLPALVISEIMYHPMDSNHAEFIELHNTGSEDIDLTGVYFTDGIDYAFPAGTKLEAGGCVVIARNPLKFEELYGEAPFGEYTKKLSNAGENITLNDAWGFRIDQVHYNDTLSWPQEPDGQGPSLELADLNSDNTLPQNWKASEYTGGAPCDLRLLLTAIQQTATDINIYPNPTTGRFFIELGQQADKDAVLRVRDALGRIVLNENLSGKNKLSVDLNSYQKGIYVVEIRTEKASVTSKIILY